MENSCYPFVNLPLPYAYHALQPFVDEETMCLHHEKHLQAYVDRLNETVESYPFLQSWSLTKLIRNASRLPPKLRTQVRNNAGGVYNHRFYFDGMAPSSSTAEPGDRLAAAISRSFGSMERFEEAWKKAALGVFGSGYAWLIYAGGQLRIVTTPNQDSPLEHGLCPVMAVDVWEHAYYLKHKNVRAGYLDDWKKVVNWERADQNYWRCTQMGF